MKLSVIQSHCVSVMKIFLCNDLAGKYVNGKDQVNLTIETFVVHLVLFYEYIILIGQS